MKSNITIYDLSRQRLTASTVIGEYGNQKITVSQMLSIAAYCIKFIKAHFNVDERKYSAAIIAIKMLELRLNNQNTDKLTAEQLKCVVDVIHEIADLHSQSDISKQENEKIAFELKALIDLYDKLQKEQSK